MENWEKQLNQVQVLDPIVSSHRDGLRKKLQSGGIPTGHGLRNTVTFAIAALLLISGLTAVYPSWAKDLLNTTLVQTITFQTKDGARVVIRKMSADQCSTACNSACGIPSGCGSFGGLPSACGSLSGAPMTGDSIRCKVMIVKHEDIGTDGFKVEDSFEGPDGKTFTISTPDCDKIWIVNGDTIASEAMTTSTEEWPDNNIDSQGDEEDPRGVLTAEDSPQALSADFELLQNYPNPFNPTTQIPFNLKQSGPVTLKVYNVTGQEVATLADGIMAAGNHTITFNGAGLPTGAYICMLTANGSRQVKTMMLTK
jgi:hypothetical protein